MEKIAIPAISGQLSAHFGHCERFVFYTIEDGKIAKEEALAPPPHAPGIIPQWVSDQGATRIIAGGMGQKAIELFNQRGVDVHVGAPLSATEEIVEAFLKGELDTSNNLCDH
ncbi:MAG: NifB/NifX family molybdenum-iron cluster-binding protein [Bacteroidales bacterium]|jgi:predicted Fe-Mo cluster-binding NifX family protein